MFPAGRSRAGVRQKLCTPVPFGGRGAGSTQAPAQNPNTPLHSQNPKEEIDLEKITNLKNLLAEHFKAHFQGVNTRNLVNDIEVASPTRSEQPREIWDSFIAAVARLGFFVPGLCKVIAT